MQKVNLISDDLSQNLLTGLVDFNALVFRGNYTKMPFSFFTNRLFNKEIPEMQVQDALLTSDLKKKELIMDIALPALTSVTAFYYYGQNFDEAALQFRCSARQFDVEGREIVFLVDTCCGEFEATLKEMKFPCKPIHPYLSYLSNIRNVPPNFLDIFEKFEYSNPAMLYVIISNDRLLMNINTKFAWILYIGVDDTIQSRCYQLG